MNEKNQKVAAKAFYEYWKDKGYEKGESQPFWLELLQNVLGVENPAHYIKFEEQVHLDHTSFIDGFIPATHVLIEQKGKGKDLKKAIKQSDGSLLTPFQQAQRYSAVLPYSQRPRWIVTCNFEEFLIYDMEKPTGEPESILLKDLEKEYYRLQFLVDADDENIKKEMEISIQAGNIVGMLYDELLKQYIHPDNEDSLKSLNMLCVRLVFCLYAEDAGVFGGHNKFHNYLKSVSVKDARRALIDLFKILDTKPEDRDPYMDKTLLDFPYVNGGLFADENIEIPQLNDRILNLLLEKASEDFDWSGISPTIFGAVFESTLNPETRRSGGMHYTSIENIHKVIDPLFLDDLQEELDEICNIKVGKTREAKLDAFRNKLASLTFLDPACGSGNFLTETYISLRRLENKAIEAVNDGQILMNLGNPIRVSIQQFYGIEINDFAVTVAKTAMWIAESQMMKETETIVDMDLDFLPLKSYVNIVEGNALRMDWESVVPKEKLNYIMGNPPFVGARLMNKAQKDDLLTVFGTKWKNAGNLDYVSCWYKKTTDMMKDTHIRAALVSTNSISQGEQVAILWKPLFENGVCINFAHRTFQWDSEANNKAHVHCVIIGFSTELDSSVRPKYIYTNNRAIEAKNINAYLIDAENIFVENKNTPICNNVPNARSGNKPIDDGNYLFTEEEKNEFIKKEPQSEKWFRPWIGAHEFINRYCRYCLWLGECPPNILLQMPESLKRVEAVRQFRLASKSLGTQKLANTPTRFHVETILNTSFLVMPLTSSERRKYVPIGFVSKEYLASNLVVVVADATLYHFGVLTSNVFMAWMRAVCGRLKSDYRITKDNVYNNFPWCNPTEEQKARIEYTAKMILDARELYPDCSFADMYGESMYLFPELLKAHQENDRAVMQAYGFDIKSTTESSCVAELMKLYQKLTKNA